MTPNQTREPPRLMRVSDTELVARMPDGAAVPIHPIWLRERSEAPEAMDRTTGQRLHDPSDLPLDLSITDIIDLGADRFEVRFSDRHAAVYDSARLAREMGGGSFAQGVAALGICLVPVYTVFDHWLMMNAFEPLIWAGFAWCLLRVADGGDRRLWLALGVLAGVGLETKYSIAFLMVGVLAGLALTPRRSELRSPWPWVGVGVAALIALPNVLWQAGHHFPFLELTRNIGRSGRDVVRDPLAFILDQAVIMGPTTLPLWAGGLGWLLVGRGRRRFAVLGWAFLFVLGAFIALKGKNYYVTPAYPMLFAAGAAGLEIATAPRARRWIRAAYGTAASAGGLILLPLSAPLLPPESLIRYEHALRIVPPDFEHQRNGPLPQYFADEFGWEDMVREVARVYHALPAAEQAGTAPARRHGSAPHRQARRDRATAADRGPEHSRPARRP